MNTPGYEVRIVQEMFVCVALVSFRPLQGARGKSVSGPM